MEDSLKRQREKTPAGDARRQDSELGAFVERVTSALGDRIELITLFGSAARGDAAPDSDIDLLIVTRGPFLEDFREIIRIAGDFTLKVGRYFSTKVYDHERYHAMRRLKTPFMQNIEREGKTLWSRS